MLSIVADSCIYRGIEYLIVRSAQKLVLLPHILDHNVLHTNLIYAHPDIRKVFRLIQETMCIVSRLCAITIVDHAAYEPMFQNRSHLPRTSTKKQFMVRSLGRRNLLYRIVCGIFCRPRYNLCGVVMP